MSGPAMARRGAPHPMVCAALRPGRGDARGRREPASKPIHTPTCLTTLRTIRRRWRRKTAGLKPNWTDNPKVYGGVG
jgi:hypothetical protein